MRFQDEDGDDSEVYSIINSAYALSPYGPEGDRYQFEIIERLKRDCMDVLGFSYTELPFYPNPPLSANAPALIPPLPSDEEVRVNGYHAWWPPNVDGTDPVVEVEWNAAAAVNDARAAEVDGWSEALVGQENGRDSCEQNAYDALLENVSQEAERQYSELAGGLAEVVFAGPDDHPGMNRAAMAWQECMVEVGYDYQFPDDARVPFYRDAGTSPSDDEVAQALADLRCLRASDYRNVRLWAVADLVTTWMTQNEARVRLLRETTAREILELHAYASALGLT